MGFCNGLNFAYTHMSGSSFLDQRVAVFPAAALPISLAASNSHKDPRISLPKRRNTQNRAIRPIKPLLSPNPRLPTTKHHQTFKPKGWFSQLGKEYGIEMLVLNGLGYWVQGFRCFPWLALNFYFKDVLLIDASVLQLVQNTANLPMVAKPLYGVVSDVLYIGDEHRVPYISIGVFLQIVSWGMMALVPIAGSALPTLMACILLGNLGASFTEVVSDSLIAECSKSHRVGELQSFAWMALALGAIAGNLSGGFVLRKTPDLKIMFLLFCLLLCFQLGVSLSTREKSLNLVTRKSGATSADFCFLPKSAMENIKRQFSDLFAVIRQPCILFPLAWSAVTTAIVPMLSGSVFYFQTQVLNVDPYIIGFSKVTGQMLVLSASVLYDCLLKKVPVRKLVCAVQIVYAISLLSDLFLVNQLNLCLGISNSLYISCFAALAEAVAQFRILPFSVLLATRCPTGSKGSLLAFFMSMQCLSSIVSGYAGAAVSSFLGMSNGNYSRLSMGILIQFVAALLPLLWVSYIPRSMSTQRKKLVVEEKRNTR